MSLVRQQAFRAAGEERRRDEMMWERGKVLQNDFKIKACITAPNLSPNLCESSKTERKRGRRRSEIANKHTSPSTKRRRWDHRHIPVSQPPLSASSSSCDSERERGSHNSVFALLCRHSRLLLHPFHMYPACLSAIFYSVLLLRWSHRLDQSVSPWPWISEIEKNGANDRPSREAGEAKMPRKKYEKRSSYRHSLNVVKRLLPFVSTIHFSHHCMHFVHSIFFPKCSITYIISPLSLVLLSHSRMIHVMDIAVGRVTIIKSTLIPRHYDKAAAIDIHFLSSKEASRKIKGVTKWVIRFCLNRTKWERRSFRLESVTSKSWGCSLSLSLFTGVILIFH